MLAEAKNSEFVAAWLAEISDLDVRDAFRFLVGAAASASSLTCHAQYKGAIRDFRFYTADGKQLFSFITNKASLLFYFRAPSLRSGRYALDDLHKGFGEAEMNARGEWTVKITTLAQAHRLWGFLGVE